MILQVFNKYLEKGGEEKSVDRIYGHLQHEGIERCFFDSLEWKGVGAPSAPAQLKKMFYNRESVSKFKQAIENHGSKVALFHNIYPVASPALYKAALDVDLPVIQYIHNFRPFSVSGTLWTGERVAEESLKGNYLAEIKAGSWQGSVVKSAIFAGLLKKLHLQEWLKSVKHWVAISDFMRDKFIDAGVPPEQITMLRHSWDMMNEPPKREDGGYYLFLSRLTTEKGVRVLLKAWEQLESELGPATPELYIGGSGDLENEVKMASEASSKIHYLGFVDKQKKAELIRKCRAMLAPSIWWEPLGLVTYEAYDHAKPMLAARSGGLSETVVDNETGILFDPNSAEAIVEAVCKVEDKKKEELLSMGDAGRDWLSRNADVDQWKSEFSAILSIVK